MPSMSIVLTVRSSSAAVASPGGKVDGAPVSRVRRIGGCTQCHQRAVVLDVGMHVVVRGDEVALVTAAVPSGPSLRPSRLTSAPHQGRIGAPALDRDGTGAVGPAHIGACTRSRGAAAPPMAGCAEWSGAGEEAGHGRGAGRLPVDDRASCRCCAGGARPCARSASAARRWRRCPRLRRPAAGRRARAVTARRRRRRRRGAAPAAGRARGTPPPRPRTTRHAGSSLEHDVVRALQRDQPGAGDVRREEAALLEVVHPVAAAVQHQRRDGRAAGSRSITSACAALAPGGDGVLGRHRDPLELVEPAHLLLGGAGDHQRREHPPERPSRAAPSPP